MSTLQHPSERVQFIDADGMPLEDVDRPEVADDTMLELYRDMYLARRFDRRTVNLNRTGEIGSFPPLYGHEAAQVASAHALESEDWIVPSYRDHAALHVHGLDLENILLYYKGIEQGNAIPDDVNVFPINGSVGSQPPHAVGLAWADSLVNESESVYACYFGDGATSQGDVHEAMNFAGVFDTPNVFFCQNNQWAISVPFEQQTAADSLASRAQGYGFEGIQIDGMDPLAVYEVMRTAVEKAKSPADDELRPTFIEAMLYRLGAHSTADDPSKYRGDEPPEEWQEKDPIPRFRTFLVETGRLDEETDDAIRSSVEDELADVIETVKSTEPPDPDKLFEHAYAEPTPLLEDQREQLEYLRETYGDDALSNHE
ncbi:pyruvate dehydrogenase (acetyl-transferring) E1 component subunit alpha [Natrarchaeobius sp. A-rgal3]|uniref:pyruvate dehydrogenase (acetyl-transferring) E1 component subunit alpha n=1 Tax=Natrarchaeobius versutus TaxID=1679078 RepID=UPI00350FAF9A